jgi:hypothetical protein
MNTDHAFAAIKDRLVGVRDSLGEAHPSIPASEIVARARRRRVRRRLIPGLTGVVALAAGTAVAVTALLPASQPASHQPRVQLTAWTVVKQPDGKIEVSIHELHNPAGLQRRLRADGVPATVTFRNQKNPACHPWPGAGVRGRHTPAGDALFSKVFPWSAGQTIVIDPSALPSGGGVQLTAGFGRTSTSIGAGLVQASPACTGS